VKHETKRLPLWTEHVVGKQPTGFAFHAVSTQAHVGLAAHAVGAGRHR
jgi:hypothetical protein